MEKREVANRLELLLLFLRVELSHETDWRIEYEKVDPNCFRLKLTLPPGGAGFSRIELRVLQIGEGVKIFGRLSDESRVSLALNLNSLIKKITRNSYVLADPDEATAVRAHFKPSQAEYLRNILRYRLVYKLTGPPAPTGHTTLVDLPEDIVGKVVAFLRPREVLSYLSASTKMTQSFLNNNEFWFHLYNATFRRTGFGLRQVAWKDAYFNKRREAKK